MFVSRDHEIGRIDQLLGQITSGQSRVLLLEGEPGSGKTALLDLAAERAGELTVLRASGVEGADQTAFAGLIGLLRPIVGLVDELPGPQAEALHVVLGERAGTGGDRFLVGVALLGILAAAAERTPVLVLVDDVQWWDSASARALMFAVRRLQADRVGTLLAMRSGALAPGEISLQDGEIVTVAPLDVQGAIQLLAADHIVASVATELHRLAGGNPLALKETAAILTAEQRRGTALPPDSAALPRSVRQAYQRQLNALSSRTRQALLIAAVGRLDDLGVLTRALRTRDLGLADLAEAEDRRLLRIVPDVATPRYEWKHPLVRAAVLDAADPSGRRMAHSAQADALTEILELSTSVEDSAHSRTREYRATRAWHLSSATVEADDRVGDELATVAVEAADGRAYSAAAAAFQRAAALTLDPATRAGRLALAAEAAWSAGDGPMTNDLVELGLEHGTGATLVTLHRLKGLYELEWRSSLAAIGSLERAFRLAVRTDAGTAMEIVAELVAAASFAGSPESDRTVCECAALADTHADRTDRHQSVLVTWAVHAARHLSFGKGLVRAVTAEELSAMYRDAESLARQDPRRFAYYVLMNNMSGDLPNACAEADVQIAGLRAEGEISVLSKLLPVRYYASFWLGAWDEAWRLSTESLELARFAGQSLATSNALEQLGEIAALRGDEIACLRSVDERRQVVEVIAGFERARLHRPLGLLALGFGHYERAATQLGEVYAAVLACGRTAMQPTVDGPDLVEALAMSGRREEAEAQLRHLVELVEGDTDAETSAVVHRLEGLVATEPAEAVTAFEAALRAHTGSVMDSPFQQARTRLLYGERLRRDGQRLAAREQLRAAATTFERLGAKPWAQRAHRELAVTGARRRPRQVASTSLSTQELRIALLAADGLSNKEIAAQMYLSGKTIEFHLGHVFRKLELRSRTQLARRLSDPLAVSPAGP